METCTRCGAVVPDNETKNCKNCGLTHCIECMVGDVCLDCDLGESCDDEEYA